MSPEKMEAIAERLREISQHHVHDAGGYPDDIEVWHGEIFIATVEDRYGADNKPVLRRLTMDEAIEEIEEWEIVWNA